MIRILTDSTSTINQNEAKKNGITVIPLTITLGDKSYLDGISANSLKVTKYDSTHKNNISHTSQPPLGKFIEAFKELTKNRDSVLAIMLGSNFSGTYETAKKASQLVKGNIKVIDSKTTDQSIRYMVMVANEMAKSKKYSMQQIIKQVKLIREHSKLYMGISTLRNLRKNGRINMMASVISLLFKLHIVVHLDLKQKLHIDIKGRGKKTFYRWLKRYLTQIKGQHLTYIGISYTSNGNSNPKDDHPFPKYAKEQLQKLFPHIHVVLRYTSATISCHTGAGAYAIMTCDK